MLTAYIYLQALFNYFAGCRNGKQHAGSLRVFTSTGTDITSKDSCLHLLVV